jgi:GTP-binding protein EngB required for normal cell division
MNQLFDLLLRLLSATARFPPDDTAHTVLAMAQQRLLVLRHRWELLDKPFVVAIVGLSNVGKSTLMNALLGDEFAPAGNYPCTSCPVEFSFGERLQLTVFPANDYRRQQWVCPDAAELLKRLMLVADEKQKTIDAERVEVTAPLPMLKDGLALADTPGFNAVQPEDHDGTYQKALEDYLRTRTSQVLWVVRASFPPDRAENTFFERFVGELCDDIIVTGAEALDEAQRRRWSRYVASHLPAHRPRFHFVSGLEGTAARRSGDSEQLKRSGIHDLEVRIRELGVASARVSALQQGGLDWAQQLGDWARNHWSETAGIAGHFWNLPEWAALTARAVGYPLCEKIVAALSVHNLGR